MRRPILVAAVLVGLVPATAQAADPWQKAQDAFARLEEQARAMVTIGGVVVYRYRHTISGAALGCATGTLAGVSSTIVLSPVTGGATLAGTGPAALLGCAAGGAAGAALGYQLDTTSPTLDGAE